MPDGTLHGYNTDYYGFKKSLKPYLPEESIKALIIGTGGASKAVAFALRKMNIDTTFVTRGKSNNNKINYNALTDRIISSHN